MKRKDVLVIIVLLFIFILVWIGSSIYHSAVSSTISEDVSQDIKPIDQNFDIKTIEKLKSRKKITPSFDLKNVAPTPITLPTLPYSPNASTEGKLLL